MKTLNTVSAVLKEIEGIPMTLESGISFDPDMTKVLMKHSPFRLKPFCDGFQVITMDGKLLFSVNPIQEAHSYENGYVYFRDIEGKYNFTTYYDIQRKRTKPFPLSYPIEATTMNIPYEIQRIANLLRFTEKVDCAKRCEDGELYKEGHYYYNGYWGEYYKVLKVVDCLNYQKVTVQWQEDMWGDIKVNTHCTPLSSQDWHFIPAQDWHPETEG